MVTFGTGFLKITADGFKHIPYLDLHDDNRVELPKDFQEST